MSRSYKVEKPKQSWEYRSSVARAAIEQNAQVFQDRKKQTTGMPVVSLSLKYMMIRF